jgi:hypothetical protein
MSEASLYSTALSDWMPIETAPKDGTAVLGYDPQGVPIGGHSGWPRDYMHHVVVMRWAEDDDGEFAWVTPMHGLYGGSSIFRDPPDWAGHDAEPTHWMPLPTPPEVTE